MSDSSITKQALADALKSLLNQQPFCKISVGDICEACGMNRKSFYYHFQDKYDLLNWIFFSEFTARLKRHTELTGWQLLRELCVYLQENQTFYRRAFEVKGQNSFSDYFHDFIVMLLAGDIRQSFLPGEDAAFCVNFYVDALDRAIWRWLQQREPMPALQFCSSLKLCIDRFSSAFQFMEKRQQFGPLPQ